MRFLEWGRIVKGVNTTPDVGVNEIPRQAKKFGNTVDKDGRPPTLSKKVKGKSTNVLFNLGLAESKMPKELYRQLKMGIEVEMEHTDNPKLAMKIAMDHIKEDPKYYDKLKFIHDEQVEEKWSAKYKRSINCSNPKGFSQKAHCAGRKKNEGAEITMWTNPEYQGADVDDKYYEKQPVKIVDISKLTPFEPADKMKPKDNHDNMMKFVDKILAGKKIKPIVIVPYKGQGLIVDGHHRYFAHLKAGVDKIRAVIADPGDLVWRDDVPESVIEAQELSSVSTIYVDMDGVLADFFGAWAKLMKKDHWTKIDDIMPALQKIRDTENFWLDLPLTANAKNLLMLIKDVKGEYNILSSPLPDDPNSEPHKREWIEKNLGFFPPKDVIITHDKAKYATTEDGTPNILIDDYGVNIQKWEAAGGVGFKHKDHKFERTAKNIKQHMQEPVEEDVKDEFGAILNPLGADSKELTKIKQSPGFHGLITTMFAQGTFADLEQDEILHYISKLLNINTVEIKAILQKDGFNFTEPDAETKFKQNMGGTGFLGKKDNERDPDLNSMYSENFADGKKPGRKGQAKRSGVNCKQSVTRLRKLAKNSTGEKRRMAHWCANMKSGKNK